jgi:hypothetical protein
MGKVGEGRDKSESRMYEHYYQQENDNKIKDNEEIKTE